LSPESGKPVARLGPLATSKVSRKPGLLRGRLWVADDFDAPLLKDILDAFYGTAVAKRGPSRGRRAKPAALPR
jgi:antitoxin (DNA-binding transcriptional repressor) of toxin-antitoxin stability system